jgi:hypothetical protein
MKMDINIATWNVRSMLQAGKIIKAQGIKWLGHVKRRDTSRTAKKNIRMENNGEPTTGKTKTEVVG